MTLMFHGLIHARDANDCLIMLTVKIQQILMIPTNRLIPKKSQQILDIFLRPIDILQRKDIEIIEIEFIVNLLKRLQDKKRILGLILDGIIIFSAVLFFGTLLHCLLFDYLGSGGYV